MVDLEAAVDRGGPSRARRALSQVLRKAGWQLSNLARRLADRIDPQPVGEWSVELVMDEGLSSPDASLLDPSQFRGPPACADIVGEPPPIIWRSRAVEVPGVKPRLEVAS